MIYNKFLKDATEIKEVYESGVRVISVTESEVMIKPLEE